MTVEKQTPIGWYNGNNIKSVIKYYCHDKKLNDTIEFIQFMGAMSVEPANKKVDLILYIRFVDGSDKKFTADMNEDGSFAPDVTEKLLKEADEWLTEYSKSQLQSSETLTQ